MTTLTLNFSVQDTVLLKLKGLSFKSTKNCHRLQSKLVRIDYLNSYAIDCTYGNFNGSTCAIKKEYLIEYLKDLRQAIHFDNIKTIGHYELTAEQLLEQITK